MRRQILRWLRRGALLLALVAVVDYFVLPRLAGTQKSIRLLGEIRPVWAVGAVVLEALSLVCYSMLTRSVLPSARPGFGWLIRTDLSALGIGHLVPGGAATAVALRYRWLRAGGTPADDAAVGMGVQGVGSDLVLVALFWVLLVCSIPFTGLRPAYIAAAVVGAVLLAMIVASISERSLLSGPVDRLARRVVRLLPRAIRARVGRALAQAARQLSGVLGDKHALLVSAAWAIGNWVLDAASLWTFLFAFGHRTNVVELFVAYGLAQTVAILPITPGGLGVIEGILIPSLVGFGTPQEIAVLGVVSWRLFEFWAPIPVGAACYASLRIQQRVQRATRSRPSLHDL